MRERTATTGLRTAASVVGGGRRRRVRRAANNVTARVRAVLLVGLSFAVFAGLGITGADPAAAQGGSLPGKGNVYYLAGAVNVDGRAQDVFAFGNPGDEVYFGDWYRSGRDAPMVRRGNTFYIANGDDPSITQFTVTYGDPGDEVFVGDWDGNGIDGLAVRRGNRWFVKNDIATGGPTADRTLVYGDPGDRVLVGNWDGVRRLSTSDQAGKGDTLALVRGNEILVKDTLATGIADYSDHFGDPGDQLLVGDWVDLAQESDGSISVGLNDEADQLAVRRGNFYYLSSELAEAHARGGNPSTERVFAYGDPGDSVFVAAAWTDVELDDGSTPRVEADGLGVRRSR